MYDFHMHSNFSSDCKFTMEEMVTGAIKKDAKAITFTDHVDFDFGGTDLSFAFTLEDYIKEIKRLKQKYKDKLQILSGVEVGLQPHITEKCNDFINEGDFDFVLMSIHTVKGQELHNGEFYRDRSPIKAYEDYYGDLLNIINRFSNFDTVGHLDLIERYRAHLDEIIVMEKYRDMLEEILRKIIDMGNGIEINTSGMRYGIDSFHPSKEILKLYKDLGGEIVTIGSDAHHPKDICDGYKEAVTLLKEHGFKYISIFKERKNQFVKI